MATCRERGAGRTWSSPGILWLGPPARRSASLADPARRGEVEPSPRCGRHVTWSSAGGGRPGHPRAVYLRYAALGDSATFGIGDPVPRPAGVAGHGCSPRRSTRRTTCPSATWRSLGATATTVLSGQLDDALAHRPDLASLVVGINDTMRATLGPAEAAGGADDLRRRAERRGGHAADSAFPRPRRGVRPARRAPASAARADRERQPRLRRGGARRTAAWRVDLAATPAVLVRDFWSVDRLHPSELGHRALARAYADELDRRRPRASSRPRSHRPGARRAGGAATSPGWCARAPRGWAGGPATSDPGPCGWPGRRPVSGLSRPVANVRPMTSADGRADDELRPITITRNWLDHAAGLRARRVRTDPGAVRGLRLRGRAALAQGLRPGLGHRGVRDAAARRPTPARTASR